MSHSARNVASVCSARIAVIQRRWHAGNASPSRIANLVAIARIAIGTSRAGHCGSKGRAKIWIAPGNQAWIGRVGLRWHALQATALAVAGLHSVARIAVRARGPSGRAHLANNLCELIARFDGARVTIIQVGNSASKASTEVVADLISVADISV